MKVDITTLNDLRTFASSFYESTPKGIAIGLSGDLGAGKTTFVRTLIEHIALKTGAKIPRVTSPTYVIETRYPQLNPCIEHFDLYRLESIDRKSLTEIGFYDALDYVTEQKGWLFVEWPEKAKREDLGLDREMRFSLSEKGRWVELGNR